MDVPPPEMQPPDQSTLLPPKAIPPARDRLQSRLVVWIVLPLVAAPPLIGLLLSAATAQIDTRDLAALAISLCFAFIAWVAKAATPGGAVSGGFVCLSLTSCRLWSLDAALVPLLVLFVLTSVATRSGRLRKTRIGLAEPRTGRHASQVIANLGVGGLLVFPLNLFVMSIWWPPSGYASGWVTPMLVIAVLAEATADTVSSEIGQAFAGRPLLFTSLRHVDQGTDGAISLLGTAAGVLAGALVAFSPCGAMDLPWRQCSVAFAGAVAGLFFDSFLGATLERRGWIGNDLVNFFSTAFAAAFALLILWLVPGLRPSPIVMY